METWAFGFSPEKKKIEMKKAGRTGKNLCNE
jgi:hypothetical protein